MPSSREATAREALVTRLAADLDLPVVLEDAAQQPIAHSPHTDLTDAMRRETILRRATSQAVVDHFRAFAIREREEPFVVPGDAHAGILPRLCAPLRRGGELLGFLWVLLRSPEVSEAELARVVDAGEALTRSLLAEHRVREAETETVLRLLHPDPDERLVGLTDVEARGAFPPGHGCVVVVLAGSAWADPTVRSGFWQAAWAPRGGDQLRAVTEQEGIAVLAIGRQGPDPKALARWTDQLSRQVGMTSDIGSAPTPTQPPGAEPAVEPVAEPGAAPAVEPGAEPRAAPGEPVAEPRAAPGGPAAQHHDPDHLVVGVSPVLAGPAEAPRAYRLARHAVRVALVDPTHRPALWTRLGTYRYLVQLPRDLLADGVDDRVARLVEEAPELTTTAVTYVAAGGAIARVAERLHVHRTTLYHRLDTVRDRYGLDLRHRGSDRTALDVGLQALRLLGRWPT
ncbi:MAG: helix-turn-helix domain-containing protein [Nitriliruptoraceae bacterium]